MDPKSPRSLDFWLNLLDPVPVGRWLIGPSGRFWAAWVVAVVVAGYTFHIGWNCMNAPQRADKNNAHVNIDFSGQYLLGRMILKGEGRYLYRRSHQKPILQDAYP